MNNPLPLSLRVILRLKLTERFGRIENCWHALPESRGCLEYHHKEDLLETFDHVVLEQVGDKTTVYLCVLFLALCFQPAGMQTRFGGLRTSCGKDQSQPRCLLLRFSSRNLKIRTICF